MAWKLDDAASHQGLRDAKIHLSEVSFRLGSLRPRVRVRLYRRPGDKEIYFEQSHFLRLPGQIGLASPPMQSDNCEAYALTLVVESLTTAYAAAVAKGLVPSDDWLVANEDY